MRAFNVLLVGAGGIGSQMIDMLIPALSAGRFSDNVGGIQIHIMDDDRVETENICHQRYEPRMVGRTKVEAVAERMEPHLSPSLTLTPHPIRLESGDQLAGFDLCVVAVDRPAARRLVHDNSECWLDLRCCGDGMVALNSGCDKHLVATMTPLDTAPASCQIPGSIESGNVQMGFALAAAHGSQWVIQNLRRMAGLPHRPTPARIYSLTFGELQFPEIRSGAETGGNASKSSGGAETSGNASKSSGGAETGGNASKSSGGAGLGEYFPPREHAATEEGGGV